LEFRRYVDAEAFRADVLDMLLENETCNNLPISLLTDKKAKYATDWLMATIVDNGEITHAALCTKPFDLLLYESGSKKQDCLEQLAREIKRLGAKPPGVLAEQGLARRFANAYATDCRAVPEKSLIVMRLDKLEEHQKAPGFCRTLDKRDMYFIPYWERSFSEDCRTHVSSIPDTVERIAARLGKGAHFIWEDEMPVSQAVHGRSTLNGAVINMVYTPPQFRGKGYATSVVAELSGSLLSAGREFCCLFADTDNPVACRMYRKLGYYDVCTFNDIRFDTGRAMS